MRNCLLFFLLVGTGLADDFTRYQIIIDRSPFGPVTASGTAEVAPGFSQRYEFVALVTSNSGQGVLQAIIFDKEANHSYFRAQGETLDNGVTVERIEADPPKLVIKRGLETAQLSFPARVAVPVAAAIPSVPARPGFQPPQQPGQPAVIRRIPFRRGNN